VKGHPGKIRLSVQIDFGFGDRVFPAPLEIVLPQLLDLGSPKLLGYTPESSIAEKFQAMVALDLENTRYKDFYDIWFLSRNLEFDGQTLAEAFRVTFEERRTALPDRLPNALTDKFTFDATKQMQWQAFLRKNRLDTTTDLAAIAQQIENFLMPVVLTISEGKQFTKTWTAGAGWSI